MPSIQSSAVTITITDVTGINLTCASTSGLYVGLVGNMVDSDGANSTPVTLFEIVSSTIFNCSFKSKPASLDFEDYDGGKIYFESQLANIKSDEILTADTITATCLAGVGTRHVLVGPSGLFSAP